ncbi:MAG: hypothetical protein J5973_05270, partial [Eubacterium sp.]|nr:hypothetical protein [Eubacterium sp.]
ISYTDNTLVITPAELTIKASASKTYDGTPLKGSDAIEVDGLAEGDNITVTATGEITDAGTAENPYTIDWGTTNESNYTVTQEPGVLTVDKAVLTLTPAYAGYSGTGTSFTLSGFSLSAASTTAAEITVTGKGYTKSQEILTGSQGPVTVSIPGGDTGWSVSVPGEDPFDVQIGFRLYENAGKEYFTVTCLAGAGLKNYTISVNEVGEIPIVYPPVSTGPDSAGNGDGAMKDPAMGSVAMSDESESVAMDKDKDEEPEQEKEEPDQEKEQPEQEKEEPEQEKEEPDQEKEEPEQEKEEPEQEKEEPEQEKEEPEQEKEEPKKEKEEPEQKKEEPESAPVVGKADAGKEKPGTGEE